jgi:hypothetical protein
MGNEHTLLSYVTTQQYMPSRENAVTDGLYFILRHSEPARQALSVLLGDESEPLPIRSVKTRTFGSDRSIPDLRCSNAAGEIVAIVESKFWAALTRHQPVTYWNRLPDDRAAVLLFLAPRFRVNGSALWDELLTRLQANGRKVDVTDSVSDWRSASEEHTQRRLVLASWEMVLDRLTDRTVGEDEQATFELNQVQGLATRITEGGNPRLHENLKKMMKAAVERIQRSGWCTTSGLGVGQNADYYSRSLLLAGAHASLVIDLRADRYDATRPLQLSFYSDKGDVPRDKVRELLGDLAKPGSIWGHRDVSVQIQLPDAGGDREAVLTAISGQLECIGHRIDPNGPTYKKDPLDA